MPFILSGFCSPSEANYCSNPLEVFFIIFQGLDEWDVFLDDKSRKDVETMLVEGAKKFSKQQFFFISPQNSAYNNPDMRKLNGDRVVIMDLEKSGDRVNNNR